MAAHVHAFDFYGGVPDELVPDNRKTAVIRRTRGKDPVLNRSYSDLAEHYGCAISPARVRRPKDKANVEAGVGLITGRAIAALRDRRFFTLGELNAALSEKVSEINSAQFTRKPGSRASAFGAQEREELAPLPKSPFQVCSWERATVRPDCHVAARKILLRAVRIRRQGGRRASPTCRKATRAISNGTPRGSRSGPPRSGRRASAPPPR